MRWGRSSLLPPPGAKECATAPNWWGTDLLPKNPNPVLGLSVFELRPLGLVAIGAAMAENLEGTTVRVNIDSLLFPHFLSSRFPVIIAPYVHSFSAFILLIH